VFVVEHETEEFDEILVLEGSGEENGKFKLVQG
jgi:hypothetical protein